MQTPLTVHVIGAAGQLGSALLTTPTDLRIVGHTSADVDITSATSVRAWSGRLAAGDVVINTAAHTDVDGAETDRDAAFAVNADGARHVAEAVAAAGGRLIHVSTDYVFPPDVVRRPLEPADLPPDAAPATVYGASKLAGERVVAVAAPDAVIARTAWVFTGRTPVRDFVTTMLRLESERDELTVVDDQLGSPTYAPDLAAGLLDLAGRLATGTVPGGVVHATNAGQATWCELARAVFAEIGADPHRVRPCTTADFPRPAPRPAYSVLSPSSWVRTGAAPLRDWRHALAEALGGPGSG